MQKKKKFETVVFLLFSLVILSSCATAITRAGAVYDYQMQTTSPDAVQMEFIGYKADTTLLSTTPEIITNRGKTYTIMSPFDQWKTILDTPSLRRIGSTLQEKNIANDQSYAYFGIYSLQELELYKSRTRYITFIEVVKNKYTVKDNGLNKNLYGGIGATFLGCGLLYNIIGAAIPKTTTDSYGYKEDNSGAKTAFQVGGVAMDITGLGFLIAAGSEAKSIINFDGAYNIYIYDTEMKEVVYKDAVTLNSTDTFAGSYFLYDSSKNVVNDYYGKLICNAILKKYDAVNSWLKSR